MGELTVHNVPIWSSVYVNVLGEKVAIHLSFHGEFDVGMNVVQVVKETIMFCTSGQIMNVPFM
jgi:hypothetical protein